MTLPLTFPAAEGFSRSGLEALVVLFETHLRETDTTSHAHKFRTRKVPMTSFVGAFDNLVPHRDSSTDMVMARDVISRQQWQ